MTQPGDRRLTLACVADQSATAAALHESLAVLFPGATIVRVDTDAERVLPPVDGAVIDSVVNGTPGIDVLRGLRAVGYSAAAVLVIDPARPLSQADELSADRLGARRCLVDGGPLTPLAKVITEALQAQDGGADGAPSNHAGRALRQTQRLLAAGELAMRLQHSLNNPLAGLLAEAQLLELEVLPAEHRASVERIIELSRRVIGVVRALDGVGRA